MNVFGDYSRYYDLLYKDKNYQVEADYLDKLLKRYSKDTMSILELGCGTGKHAALLAEKGYEMTGVDMSEEMLVKARDRKIGNGAGFIKGDIRSVRIGKKFDAVFSLFHVISYQTTNADVEAAFSTAGQHVKSGGLFIFDIWYLPAVITHKPSVRIKRMEDSEIVVTRLAEPEIHAVQNTVDVKYEVILEDKKTQNISKLTESHKMRYFSTPEITQFLNRAGFEIVCSEEWLSAKTPGFDTWGVCFVAKSITPSNQ